MVCFADLCYIALSRSPGTLNLLNVKPNSTMLNMASNLSRSHKCVGIILMGDFNARHTVWNDKLVNPYGKLLVESIDWTKFCVFPTHGPTFISKNGSSVIDLVFTSTSLDRVIRNCRADYDAHLYSGAPLRGHVPVLFDICSQVSTPSVVEVKLDLTKMDWFNWNLDIELALSDRVVDDLNSDGTSSNLLQKIMSVINKATKSNCTVKRICSHSKPYWTPELSEISKRLTPALKSYQQRNTDERFAEYHDIKEEFEEARKLAETLGMEVLDN